GRAAKPIGCVITQPRISGFDKSPAGKEISVAVMIWTNLYAPDYILL
ncbi:MAG: hypothetical protein ACJAVW_003056, partial [Spirosomataceae bacterium]